MPESRPSPRNGELERTLGLKELVLIVVGTVIGSGIFIVPGAVLRAVDADPGVALLVWLVAGLLSLLGALTYGELGAMQSEAGGLYVYLRDAFGRFPAFIYGWTLFFVISAGSLATLAVAFAGYLDVFVTLGALGQKLVAIAMIVVVAAINVVGTRNSASVQNVTTALKAGAIIVMGLLLLGGDAGMDAVAGPAFATELDLGLLSGVGLATVAVLWAYEGWTYVTFSAGEAKDPQRTFPRGIAIGTVALVGIYLLANIGYIAALGPDGAAATDRVAADAVGALLGPAAGKLIAAIILISMFSAANGLTLTAPRVYFAMARDRLFFRGLAHVDPRFGTPAIAIVASSAWGIVLAASGTFEQLLTYVVFTGWIFYALGAASIFVYRRRFPDAHRPFRVPGYPLTPALFILAAAAIVLNTVIAQPGRAMVGIVIALIGAPAYLVWRSRAAETARERHTGPEARPGAGAGAAADPAAPPVGGAGPTA